MRQASAKPLLNGYRRQLRLFKLSPPRRVERLTAKLRITLLPIFPREIILPARLNTSNKPLSPELNKSDRQNHRDKKLPSSCSYSYNPANRNLSRFETGLHRCGKAATCGIIATVLKIKVHLRYFLINLTRNNIIQFQLFN